MATSNLPNYSTYTPNNIPVYSTQTEQNQQTGTTTPGTNPTGITSYGNVGDIASALTDINIANQNKVNQARIPGAAGLEATSSSNIAQELAGNVPVDVINQLGQQAAERGISGTNVNADYLKALGLTSLGQQQTGEKNLAGAYARNPGAQIYDSGQQVLTAEQQSAAAQSAAALAEQQREDQEKNQLAQQQQLLAQQTQAQQYGYEEQQLQQQSKLAYAQMAQEQQLEQEKLQEEATLESDKLSAESENAMPWYTRPAYQQYLAQNPPKTTYTPAQAGH